MKQSKSLSLGHAYSQIEQLLSMEQELSEVTFHYGAGVRLHLDSEILGIRHAQELLAGFLYKRSCPCSPVYYLFSGIYTSGKAKEGLCGYVMKYLNHPPLPGESYLFVSRNHKCLTCLTQTSSGICLESHYLCEGTYDLPTSKKKKIACIPLSAAAFQYLLSMPKKGIKKGGKSSLF